MLTNVEPGLPSPLTAQTIFDTVVARLRAQGAQSVSADGTRCLYRGAEGRKCAVGWLISDAAYDPMMDAGVSSNGQCVEVLCSDYAALRVLEPFVELLDGLQSVHDRTRADRWEVEWARLANRVGLTYTPPSEVTR